MSAVHSKSSPTALSVAYRRTLANIPFCDEIFRHYKQLFSPSDFDEEKQKKVSGDTPYIEARSLIIDRLLGKKPNISQTLELACGLTQRGVIFGNEHPDARCVEVDLLEMIERKSRVLDSLHRDRVIQRPANLSLVAGNVTDMASLSMATRSFRNEPIAILFEGLMRYLSMFEKRLVAKHCHALLSHYGGYVITPDVVTKTGVGALGEMMKKILGESYVGAKASREVSNARLGFDPAEHYFENVGAAIHFYESLGFRVGTHCLADIVDELASPGLLGIDIEIVREAFQSLHAFVMSPA